MQTDLGDVACKLDTVFEAPQPLSRPFADHLSSRWPTRLIIYGPPISTEGDSAPSTVLVVSDEGWLVASENPEGGVSIERAPFSDTLFVELTSILLWGQLKIDYASVGAFYSAAVRFSTVEEELYREAVDLISSGIDPGRGISGGKGNPEAAAPRKSPRQIPALTPDAVMNDKSRTTYSSGKA